MKRVVNHHKLRRKVTRNVHRSQKWWQVFRFGKPHKRRDFAWREGGYRNPFMRQTDELYERRRLYWNLSVLIVVVIGTLGFLIFHSFFTITNTNITGLQRIEDREIRTTLDGILDYKRLGILHERNYFLSDVDSIRDILMERFPIQRIVVTKEFPNNLTIHIEEKLSTLIYDNGDTYSYMDDGGNIVELVKKVGEYEWKEVMHHITTTTVQETSEVAGSNITTSSTTDTTTVTTSPYFVALASSTPHVVTSTIEVVEQIHTPDVKIIMQEMGVYPLVYDMRHTKVVLNMQVMPLEETQALIAWYQELDRNTDIPFKYFTIEDDIGTLKIQTYEGWHIVTRLSKPVHTQIGELTQLLDQEIDRERLNYIDMRYPDRVYWQ